ncbi:hypothetical protein L596_014704 [Steinernema carpocapsae]|uniref:Uncharacterized protein n=1 Tax=Steinernema carpocapsae TaxID=34508 RepID=A0A4U5NDI8_STECR|nr:hypothetical protein L596_014704 [Steinernema carpocapsae]
MNGENVEAEKIVFETSHSRFYYFETPVGCDHLSLTDTIESFRAKGMHPDAYKPCAGVLVNQHGLHFSTFALPQCPSFKSPILPSEKSAWSVSFIERGIDQMSQPPSDGGRRQNLPVFFCVLSFCVLYLFTKTCALISWNSSVQTQPTRTTATTPNLTVTKRLSADLLGDASKEGIEARFQECAWIYLFGEEPPAEPIARNKTRISTRDMLEAIRFDKRLYLHTDLKQILKKQLDFVESPKPKSPKSMPSSRFRKPKTWLDVCNVIYGSYIYCHDERCVLEMMARLNLQVVHRRRRFDEDGTSFNYLTKLSEHREMIVTTLKRIAKKLFKNTTQNTIAKPELLFHPEVPISQQWLAVAAFLYLSTGVWRLSGLYVFTNWPSSLTNPGTHF